MEHPTLAQRMGAEFLGTCLLLAALIGSGIMAERLAGGNEAIALLGNTLPTAAILVVLLTMLGPVSGAHLNPVVTAACSLRGDISMREVSGYVIAQCAGAGLGVLVAHGMFELPLLQLSIKARSGLPQGFSECVATFGLVITIFLTLRAKPQSVPVSVGLYITAAYWFTASTSFANPAVTLARAFSDTFAGIRLADVPLFTAAQFLGAGLALVVMRSLIGSTERTAARNLGAKL